MAKKNVGRPVEFKGFYAQQLVKVVRKHGLTKGRELLRTEALVSKKRGQEKQKVKVSIPTLAKLASEAGVSFKRGRPLKVAA